MAMPKYLKHFTDRGGKKIVQKRKLKRSIRSEEKRRTERREGKKIKDPNLKIKRESDRCYRIYHRLVLHSSSI